MEDIVSKKSRRSTNRDCPPIGDALLSLLGGIQRAEQALALNDQVCMREERQILSDRIGECKHSIEAESFPSIPRRFLVKNAPAMLSNAEATLQRLSDRLSSAIRLTANDFKRGY